MADDFKAEVLEGQPCPMCRNKTLSLTEAERDIPFFGKVYLFSMTCTNCKYHKADLECINKQEPVKYTLEISKKEDLNIRIIKSAEATVKIPFMVSIESGPAANGYITNVEGLLNRVKYMINVAKEGSDDQAAKKKAKNMLKKLLKVMEGHEKLKIILEDPSGNSAIISDKAKKSKL